MRHEHSHSMYKQHVKFIKIAFEETILPFGIRCQIFVKIKTVLSIFELHHPSGISLVDIFMFKDSLVLLVILIARENCYRTDDCKLVN